MCLNQNMQNINCLMERFLYLVEFLNRTELNCSYVSTSDVLPSFVLCRTMSLLSRAVKTLFFFTRGIFSKSIHFNAAIDTCKQNVTRNSTLQQTMIDLI